jgi:hypothetical protein
MKRWQVLLIAALAVGLVSRGIATPESAARTGPTTAIKVRAMSQSRIIATPRGDGQETSAAPIR